MKYNKETPFLEALRTVSVYLEASPEDKPKLIKGRKAAERVIDDFIRAKNKETRRLRMQVKLIRTFKSINRIRRKLGREEVPMPAFGPSWDEPGKGAA